MKLIVNNKLISLIINRSKKLEVSVSNSIESERRFSNSRTLTLLTFDRRLTRFVETSYEYQLVL